MTGYSGCTQESLSLSATSQNQISGNTYDAAGDLAVVPGTGGGTYSYNALGQMSATNGVSYFYDGDGKRVKKSNGKLYWYGTSGNALDETDLGGNLISEFVFFDGKRIARRDSPSNGVYYYFADHLGTSREIVQAGQSASCYDADFYPFGVERTPYINTCPHSYKFTGKERDSESSFDYFDARHYASTMGRFMTADPSGLLAQKPANPQSWNLYAYAMNNPLINIDPTGLDCVYANDAGNGVESIDHNSNSGECGDNGGSWVPGYADENWAHFNNNTNMFQVGSFNGSGNNATVDYTMFAAGAQTQFNGDESSCNSGCAGFSLANANWLQNQLVGNSMLGGLDGYIQFLTGRETPLQGGLLIKLAAGPLDPSQDHWAGPGGMGPPDGRGDWAASVHDYNFSTNDIKVGSYFNPTVNLATSKALIKSNNTLMRNAGGIQSVKMFLFFGPANALQWYANSWK